MIYSQGFTSNKNHIHICVTVDPDKKEVTIYTGDWFDRWGNRHDGKYITRKLRNKTVPHIGYKFSVDWFLYRAEKFEHGYKL